MKISSTVVPLVAFLAAGFSLVQAQGQSQAECANWTQWHVYDYQHADMQQANDDYIAGMKAKIEENCFDSNGVAIECSIDSASDIPERQAYETECYNGGGRIWTYDYHPLCGPISSTSQTSVKPVLVCASASCVEVGVANLIPQQALRELKNYSCASGTGNLKSTDPPSVNSQPECYNWTQAHLFDTNPAMKPAEDAYLDMVATKIQTECIDTATNEAKSCDIKLEPATDSISQTYQEECERQGGKIHSYTLQPQCNPRQPDTEMKVEPVLVCASASCYDVGVVNLYPPQEQLYKHLDAVGITCGSASGDLEQVSSGATKTTMTMSSGLLMMMGAMIASYMYA